MPTQLERLAALVASTPSPSMVPGGVWLCYNSRSPATQVLIDKWLEAHDDQEVALALVPEDPTTCHTFPEYINALFDAIYCGE